MNVQTKKISELKPYWRNPRNNEPAVDAVVESIKSFGYVTPIIVDKNMVIVAGHTRYKALQRLGVEEVPVVVAEGMTEEQARGYRIMDNKTNELATWNQEHLIPELRAFTDLSKFQVFFPELKLDMPVQDVTFNDVTQREIEAQTSATEKQFADVAKNREKAIRTYTCPHCGGEFDSN